MRKKTIKSRLKKWVKSNIKAYKHFLHYNELMSFYWPVLSENNDDNFKDFCNLFTFYLCAYCPSNIQQSHPTKADWFGGHHNAKLIRLLLLDRDNKNLFEGIMAAFAAYKESDNKTFLEEVIARAFIEGHPGVNRTSKLFRTVQFFATHQSDTFICHGIESLEKFSDDPVARFPPVDSMQDKSISQNGLFYAIETDRLPLINCASTHSLKNPWDYCKGVIPKSIFRNLKGKILLAPDRDHFYAESDISIDDWCFVYFRKARRKGVDFDINLMRQKISEIRSSKIRIIEFETLQAFLRLLALLQQKFEMFELMNNQFHQE